MPRRHDADARRARQDRRWARFTLRDQRADAARRLLRRTSHCGLGQTAGNPVRDTWLKFRPAYERRLIRSDFDPAVDLDAALDTAREIAGRDDAVADIGAQA